MRLLVLGSNSSELLQACNIAAKKGAIIRNVNNIDDTLEQCRIGGVDLILAELEFNIKELVSKLINEHISINIVACGINNKKEQIIEAIKNGAKEYLPLPPEEDLIAAILEAITHSQYDFIATSEAMKKVVELAKKFPHLKQLF